MIHLDPPCWLHMHSLHYKSLSRWIQLQLFSEVKSIVGFSAFPTIKPETAVSNQGFLSLHCYVEEQIGWSNPGNLRTQLLLGEILRGLRIGRKLDRLEIILTSGTDHTNPLVYLDIFSFTKTCSLNHTTCTRSLFSDFTHRLLLHDRRVLTEI